MEKQTKKYILPEVLAPAGSMEGFKGALAAGADAIYLGGQKYGARAYAENFGREELIACIRQAHLLERKVYMTVNVATKDDELEDTVAYVKDFYEHGLDGVIVQDLGVIKRLREECPNLLLHASTQLSVTSAEAVRFLKQLGVCRVVPARELSLAEMEKIKEEEPIEIEAFIHGAMCYSYSGRCLMSSFLGGRSGNRGRCAGTCRLPFTVRDGEGNLFGKDAKLGARGECYPLSMKDLCVLEILPELIDAGINSFKIEGRMKKPEYAAGTTAFYRKYVDRFVEWDANGRKTPWKIDKEDLKELRSLYIRSELSTGYYHKRNGRDMVTVGAPGYAGADAALLDTIKERLLMNPAQRDIRGNAVFIPGKPASFTLTTGSSGSGAEISVTVEGNEVQEAQKRPMTESDLAGRLSKMGDTVFGLKDLKVKVEGNVFLPVGAINGLRREAVAALEEAILTDNAVQRETVAKETDRQYQSGQTLAGSVVQKTATTTSTEGMKDTKDRQTVWASVLTVQQLDAVLEAGVQHIIVEETTELRERVRKIGNRGNLQFYLALPFILRADARGKIQSILVSDELCLYKGVIARTLEEVELLKEIGYSGEIISDSSIYTWNRSSGEVIMDAVDRDILSLELSSHEIKPLLKGRSNRLILPVYGRIPMMITANCVRKTEGQCIHKEREGEFLLLEDRKKAKLPVRCACNYCYNVIYNSLPLSLHKYTSEQVVRSCGGILCSFTTENRAETEKMIQYFLCVVRDGGSMKAPEIQFTNGHFIKSVL